MKFCNGAKGCINMALNEKSRDAESYSLHLIAMRQFEYMTKFLRFSRLDIFFHENKKFHVSFISKTIILQMYQLIT